MFKFGDRISKTTFDKMLVDGHLRKLLIAKKYYVHRDGYVINIHRKVLRYSISKFGYKRIHIKLNNGKTVTTTIHRLVALEFVDGKSRTKKIVNHINGNKLDCRHTNLEWVSYKENTRHAIESGLLGYTLELVVKDLKDNSVTTFPNIEEFARYIKLSTNSLIRYIGTPERHPLLGRFVIRLKDVTKIINDKNHGSAKAVYVYDHVSGETTKLRALIHASYIYGVNVNEVKKAFLKGEEKYYISGLTFSKNAGARPISNITKAKALSDRQAAWSKKILTMCSGIKTLNRLTSEQKDFKTIKEALGYLNAEHLGASKIVKLLHYNRTFNRPAVLGDFLLMRLCDNFDLTPYNS